MNKDYHEEERWLLEHSNLPVSTATFLKKENINPKQRLVSHGTTEERKVTEAHSALVQGRDILACSSYLDNVCSFWQVDGDGCKLPLESDETKHLKQASCSPSNLLLMWPLCSLPTGQEFTGQTDANVWSS